MGFFEKLFGIKQKGKPVKIDFEAEAKKREAEFERQKALLGDKYLCHPSNFVQKLPVPDKRYIGY